ncbi:hypothetical protein RR46_00659 [Papilio xuthus]|uniref:Selenoprotein O n=1 Tax=Papilio xuthus TaxID=66420 RepID=A0A0N1I3L0_PAPXU|nr:hypothetical protein RR46_00659 [Papilio xuthus]
MMQQTMADYTQTFRQLAELDVSQLSDVTSLESKWSLVKVSKASQWEKWVQKYCERLEQENVKEEVRHARMLKVNPLYIPNNWILQEAIADAEKNDFGKVRLLLKVFMNPYEVNEEAEKLGYSSQPPSWSYGIKLSCSS